MTVLLLILCGSLIIVLFAKLSTTERAVAQDRTELVALRARLDALESVSASVLPEVMPVPAASTARAKVADAARAPVFEAGPAESAPPPERPHGHEGPTMADRLVAQLRSGWDQWIAQNLLAAAGGAFVLLGAAFFVAIAISNGWLTPWRQVAAALVLGAFLLAAGWRTWPADASRRAPFILAQALVGTGGGVMVLAVVAGARIYDHPLYPPWLALLGAGAISAIVVATSVRWSAQVTAGLGIAAAVAAPFLVGAPASGVTIAFSLVALAAAAVVIGVRGWPWLLQVAIVGSLLQPARWALDHQLGRHGSTALLAVLVVWWALLALPALFFEVRADTPRLRMPTSGALFEIAGLAVLFGRLAFGSFHAPGFEVLLCVLAALHLVSGGVMLRLRPSSQQGALFVWAVGAALAAGAAAVLLGGAAQPAFWAVETIAMLWLYVRFSDLQAGVTAGLLGALTLVWTLHLAPPDALVHPLGSLATGVLALASVVAMLAGAALALRRDREAAVAAATAAWVALLYLVAVLVVGLVAPVGNAVDQAAQLYVSGAWAVLATAAAGAAGIGLSRVLRAHVRIGLQVTLSFVAVKAISLDTVALGAHAPHVLWLLGAMAGLAAVLAAIEHRLPGSGISAAIPLATPIAFLLVLGGLVQPGVDAYRAGTTHLLETLAVLSLALLSTLFALWRSPTRARADALVLAVVLAVEGLALATVTLATPHLGVTSELAQRAMSVGPLLLAVALLGGRIFLPRLSPTLGRRVLWCIAGLVALAGALGVADTVAFGATGLVVTVSACWLIGTVALSLGVRALPRERLLLVSAVVGVAVCVFGLVITATPRALAYGAPHGWWALAAAALATLVAVVATACMPERWRTAAVALSLLVALYGVSVVVVTALTPDSAHVAQAAQLALSIVWTAWGVALLASGVARRTSLGLFLRRGGIALTGLAAAKVLIVDTAQFDTAHRAGVFLGLGLILLLGAYAYARLTRRLEAAPA